MRAVKYLTALLFAVILAQGSAFGQTTGTCVDALSAAERDYLDGAYQSAVSSLTTCLLQGEYDTATKTQAYRLLSLSYLKLDELTSARGAVVQLLSENPAYEPDPVNDLPSYRALVRLVRDQLGLGPAEQYPASESLDAGEDSIAETENEVEVEPPLPRFGNFLITTAVGVGSYGGERGVDAKSWLGEFSRNAGPLMGLRAEYSLSPFFLIGLRYSVAEYPHIVTNKSFRENHEEILPEGSSKWAHILAATLRGRVRGTDWLYPYAVAGAATSYHYVNNSFSAGIGPLFAVGADFFIDPTMVLFIEGEGLLIFPGSALDLADHHRNFDPLTSISAGVRFRVSSIGR